MHHPVYINRKGIIALLLLFLFSISRADDYTPWENYLMELYEDEEDDALNFQTAYEQLIELQKSPIDINTADVTDFLQIPGLDINIINDIIEYRDKFGHLQTITELALIPSIDDRLRNYLSCFLFIAKDNTKWYDKQELLKLPHRTKHRITITASIPAYYRAGDIALSNTKGNKYAGKYLGDPVKHSLRYNLRVGNNITFNFAGGKSAAEPFGSYCNKTGYDTYSFNLMVTDVGIVRRVIVGQYNGQFGMGLTLNTNFTLNKQSMTAAAGRLSNTFTPHSSVSDNKHFQGFATNIDITNRLQLSAMFSHLCVDATLNADSTSVSTLLYSPQHRTHTEIKKKGNTKKTDAGLHLRYISPIASSIQWNIGTAFILSSFNRKLEPTFSKADTISASKLYRLYYPHGKTFWNYSIDYSLRWKHITLSGETAINDQWALATINSAIWRVKDDILTISAIQRYYSYKYNTINGSSFYSGGAVQNETGVFLAAKYRLLNHITIDAYTDIAYYPYLKYRISDASSAWDNSMAVTYTHNLWNVSIRYRVNSRQKDYTYKNRKQLIWRTDQRLRILFTYDNDRLRLRSQIEGCKLSYENESYGILLSQAMNYVVNKKWNFYISCSYFNTKDYNSRIYNYERGMLYSFGYSPFYGKGLRLATMINFDISNHLIATIKIGNTRYFDRKTIGTAERTIFSNQQTDFDLQLRIKL